MPIARMIQTRKALLRAIATPASTYTSTAPSSRSFTSLLRSSRTISQSSALTRPQRSAVLASLYRRTYATTDDAKAAAESAQKTAGETVDAAKETLATNAGSIGTNNQAQDTARAAQDSASTFIEAVRDSGESVTERVKDGVGAVGDALSGAASRAPRASSAQGTPIKEEPTRTPRTEGGSGSNLYIGNLYFEVTGQRLQEEFGRFGQVKSAKVISDARGLSKGFGYVEFNDEQSATAARNALDGQQFEGRQMVVQYAIRSRPGPRDTQRNEDGYINAPAKTLFIGNLSYEMSDKDLNDLFREIKNVLDVRVAIDRRTGQPRGFAHADFVDVKSAEAAAEFLKTREFYGRRLRVDFASQSSGARQ